MLLIFKSTFHVLGSGLSDPFVTVEVCPETTMYKSKIFKTAVHSQTLDPEFNETFTL